jgi:hypothetical protein
MNNQHCNRSKRSGVASERVQAAESQYCSITHRTSRIRKYTLARWWLARRGDLPWRLMRFLHKAQALHGVLHQTGGANEFRDIELQRHLAKHP